MLKCDACDSAGVWLKTGKWCDDCKECPKLWYFVIYLHVWHDTWLPEVAELAGIGLTLMGVTCDNSVIVVRSTLALIQGLLYQEIWCGYVVALASASLRGWVLCVTAWLTTFSCPRYPVGYYSLTYVGGSQVYWLCLNCYTSGAGCCLSISLSLTYGAHWVSNHEHMCFFVCDCYIIHSSFTFFNTRLRETSALLTACQVVIPTVPPVNHSVEQLLFDKHSSRFILKNIVDNSVSICFKGK